MANLLGQRMLIINSSKVAGDLLGKSMSYLDAVVVLTGQSPDKKSSIYSDRPVLMMGTELVGWRDALGMAPYGERFRDLRRLMHGQ
jgi:hypothetical protein